MSTSRSRSFLTGALGGVASTVATKAISLLNTRRETQAPPAADPKPADPIESTYSTTIERTRQAARWAVAAFGAVAAALVVGVQLTDLRKLSGTAHADAVLGAAIGFTGVVIAIAGALWIQRPDEVSLVGLAAQTGRHSFAKAIEHDPSPLRDRFATLPEVVRALSDKRHAYATETDYDRKAILYRQLTELGEFVREIELRGHFYRFSNRFKLATIAMFLGAVMTGAGLLTFAAQSENPAVSTAETAPTAITITLSREGKSRLAIALGKQCVAAPVPAIALANDAGTLDVVTIQTAKCTSVRFSLTDSLGTSTPTTPTQPR